MIIHNAILTGSLQLNGTNLSTGNLVTTGSNTFVGNQVISGSLTTSGSITATGTLTAQTLVVQTITASTEYSSGSNVFGNNIANTQTFTGSVNITGSNHYIFGSVGIGTGSVAVPLHVDVAGGGIVRVSRASAGTNYAQLESDGTNGTLTSNTSMNFNAGGSTRMFLSGSGNVGIGTTTNINQRLTIVDANDAESLGVYRNLSAASDAGTYFRLGALNGSSVPTAGAAILGVLESGKTSGYLGLYTYTGSAAVERIRIDRNGNVGIGTTPSRGALDVRGGRINLGGTSADAQAVFTMGDATYPVGSISAPYGGGAVQIQGSSGTGLWVTGSAGSTLVGIGTTTTVSNLIVYSSSFPVLKVADGIGGGALALGDSAITSNYVGIWRGTSNSTSGGGYLNVQGNGIAFMSSNNTFGSGTNRIEITNAGQINTYNAPSADWGMIVRNANSGNGNSYGLKILAGNGNGDYSFQVANGGNTTTYFIIRGDGKVFSYMTGADDSLNVTNTHGSVPYGINISFSAAAPNNTSQYFLNCGDTINQKAIIYSNGTFGSRTSTYGGISDLKLKENITPATSKLDDLLKVNVVNYNFIDDEKKEKQIGVISQELELIFPNMVFESEEKETGEKYKNVKYSVFVPMLIKAIQELKTEFDAYKATHP